jgi:hypothetical protein
MHARTRSRSVRSSAAMMLAAALLALVAAGCSGTSASPTGDPAGSAAPSAAVQPSSGSGGAVGGGSGAGAASCDRVREAATLVALQMQLLYQADSAAQWTSMTDPATPVRLDATSAAAAVDVLATLPGSGDLVASYREIVDLERQAESGDPWGDGSGPGARAHALVKATFIDLGVALSTLLEAVGC